MADLSIRTSHDPRPSLRVSIVSANLETLDGLQSYLGRAGILCRCATTLDDLETLAPQGTTAAVIFPDHFDDAVSVALVQHLRHARPRLLTVIVTREPQRFTDVRRVDARSLPLVVLARPSLGREILDALRAHADAMRA